MSIDLNGRYRHRLRDLECTVTTLHGDRQRAIIRFEDGREMQEVPYHDLLPCTPRPPVVAPSPPATPVAEPPVPTPTAVAESETAVPYSEPIQDDPPPRRSRFRLDQD